MFGEDIRDPGFASGRTMASALVGVRGASPPEAESFLSIFIQKGAKSLVFK